MEEINCLVCDELITFQDDIDTENYDGEVTCQECTSLLYIKLVKSVLRKYRVVEKRFKMLSIEEIDSIVNYLVKMPLKKPSGGEGDNSS